MSRRSTSRWIPAALMKYGFNSGLFDRALVVVDEIFFCIGGAPQGRLWSASRTASRLSQIIAASRSSGQYLLKYEVLVNACSSKHDIFDGTYFSVPRNTPPRKLKAYGTTRKNESS